MPAIITRTRRNDRVLSCLGPLETPVVAMDCDTVEATVRAKKLRSAREVAVHPRAEYTDNDAYGGSLEVKVGSRHRHGRDKRCSGHTTLNK